MFEIFYIMWLSSYEWNLGNLVMQLGNLIEKLCNLATELGNFDNLMVDIENLIAWGKVFVELNDRFWMVMAFKL